MNMNEAPRTNIHREELESIYSQPAPYINRMYILQNGNMIRLAFTEDVAGQGGSMGDTYARGSFSLDTETYLRFAQMITQHAGQLAQNILQAQSKPQQETQAPNSMPVDDTKAMAELDKFKAQMAQQNGLKYE